jgi:integrase
VEKGPKSAAGHRDIPLSQELARAMLRRARDAFNAGDTKRIRGLYVLGTPDGRPYNPTVLTREFSSLAKLYNIRCVSGKQATFYALRHTAITTMLRQGVDAKTVSSLAGHSKVAETLDIYAVADADAKRRAVAKVAEAMAS